VQRTPDEAWVHGTFVLEPFQRYFQSILLNEWLEFSQVGRYSLTIRFRGSILPETDRVTVAPETSIRIDVLPFDERVLRNKCKQLLQALVDGRTAGDWFAAGKALGAVKHPVAVEYLSLAIKADQQVDSIAIGALLEIGDQTARAA
jgi:hypothetical protein